MKQKFFNNAKTSRLKTVQQRTYDRKEETVSEGEVCLSNEILIQELQQMFQNLENKL
jgi:hypothetical protein